MGIQENEKASVILNEPERIVITGSAAAEMCHRGIMIISNPAAGRAATIAQIDFIKIHEQPFIKHANP